MDPLKLGRPVLGLVMAVVLCAYAVRWAYELVRPVLPLVAACLALLVGAQVWRWWHRRW